MMRKQLEQLVIVPKCAATAVAKKTEICPDRRSVLPYLSDGNSTRKISAQISP